MKANRTSITAVKVGRILMHLHHHEKLKAVLPDGVGEWNERLMLASGEAAPWMIDFYESERWRKFLTWMEAHSVPGQTLAYGTRKAFMDAEVGLGIDSGARQVLMVGAGFDSLCARRARLQPEVTFVEIDHPATQKTKLEALNAMDGLSDNLILDPVDLSERDLHEVLAGLEVWDCDARSVVAAEAVLCYLDEGDVRGFFDAARRSVSAGSTVAFTYMRRDENGEFYFGHTSALVQRSLELVGEPIKWAIFPPELEAFLSDQGWRLVTDPARNDVKARFLDPVGLGHESVGDAELFAVAEAV